MGLERMEVASKPCPCGKGLIRIDWVYRETDWGNQDQEWEAEFTCTDCCQNYRVVSAGRGVDIIRNEDLERAQVLLEQAGIECRTLLKSELVTVALDKLASLLEALPSVAAQYRVVHELGLVTESLATFRKHNKGAPVKEWLSKIIPLDHNEGRSILLLTPVFDHFEMDRSPLLEMIARRNELRKQAAEVCAAVMSLGPINFFAALHHRPS